MGCGKSTLAHGVDANENDVIIVKEEHTDHENGTDPVKIEGVEAKENSLQESGRNQKAVIKPTMMKHRHSLTRKSDSGRGIENAWGDSKVKKNVENTAAKPPRRPVLDDLDFESEYGRDGVDLTSTHVNNEADKLLSSALGPRTSPDGTTFANNNEGINSPCALHKDESDEAFDPSALIDIEKFKAANAPVKQTTTNKDQEGPKTDTEVSANTTKSAEVEIVSPSNYNEFYDDDEKQLIESIENDFVTLSSPALPGTVLSDSW